MHSTNSKWKIAILFIVFFFPNVITENVACLPSDLLNGEIGDESEAKDRCCEKIKLNEFEKKLKPTQFWASLEPTAQINSISKQEFIESDSYQRDV